MIARAHCLGGFVLASVTAFGLSPVADAAEHEWSYFSVSPPMHPYSEILTAAFDRIEERSNGELAVELVYFGETPYKGAEAEKLMRDGLVEMTEWLVAYSTSTYPLLSGPGLPFLPATRMEPGPHIVAIDSAWASEPVASELAGILDRHNARRLSRFYWAPQNHWLTKEVKHPADFKGLKIREYSADGIDFTNAIGATPVSMTAPDVYSALQRGALDGVVTASTSMTGLKWGEVLDAGYITNFKLSISLILVAEDAYAELTPETQAILDEEVVRATDEILSFMVEGEEKLHRQLESDYGFTFTYATPEDYTALRQIAEEHVWPKWIDSVGTDVGQPILNGVLEALDAVSGDKS